MSTTLSFNNTKALTATGVKTFTVNDRIAVIYINSSGNTLKAESEPLTASNITDGGKSATISVILTSPKAGKVEYVYPASIALEDGSVNDIALMNNQKGTLADIASNYDYRKGLGSLSINGEFYELSSGNLDNQLFIASFTIEDGSQSINDSITDFTIEDGTYTYSISRSVSSDPIWLAMHPISGSQFIHVTAGTSSDRYEKTLFGKTLLSGFLYNVSVVASKVVGTGSLDGINWSMSTGGILTISGHSGIPDFNKEGSYPTINDRPWLSWKNDLREIFVLKGVTRIGNRAF